MSRSIGPAGTVEAGAITNARTGTKYEVTRDSKGPVVETVTGHGLELSPFDLHAGSPGMDQALTNAMYPRAEQPWDLRVEIAPLVGRPDLALTAADASTRLWPSNAHAWMALATVAEARGDVERARRARDHAAALTGRLKPAPTR